MIIICSKKAKKIIEKWIKELPEASTHVPPIAEKMGLIGAVSGTPITIKERKYLKKVRILHEDRFKLDFQPDYSKLIKP